jgi:hypothetical protein
LWSLPFAVREHCQTRGAGDARPVLRELVAGFVHEQELPTGRFDHRREDRQSDSNGMNDRGIATLVWHRVFSFFRTAIPF